MFVFRSSVFLGVYGPAGRAGMREPGWEDVTEEGCQNPTPLPLPPSPWFGTIEGHHVPPT